jgi:superfamily I DNA/RNA helicase
MRVLFLYRKRTKKNPSFLERKEAKELLNFASLSSNESKAKKKLSILTASAPVSGTSPQLPAHDRRN